MSNAARKIIDDVYPTRCGTQDEWLEREDPVVWGQWSPEAPLTRAQIDSFERQGFLVLRNLFSPAEIAALREESFRLRSGESDLDPEAVITEPGSGDIRTVFQLELQSKVFNRLASDRRLAGVARFLLDDEVYIHQSRLNYKPGFTGKEFYWHSDFETWHAEDGMPRMRALSASVLLTDNDALNGPLMLIPRSQNMFISCAGETPEDNYKSSLKAQKVGVPSDESLTRLAQLHGIEYAAGDAGTVILFDCNVMHGSNGNITPFPRSNAFFVFNAWSNRPEAPYAAQKPRPEFLGARSTPASITVEHGPFA
ncbi:MAG TPA: ectoine hydroxylase [Devosiaceae bacterium]